MATDIKRIKGNASEAFFVVGKNGSSSLKHETLCIVVQAVCNAFSFYGDVLWCHFLSVESAIICQFQVVLSLFRPLHFSRDIVRKQFCDLIRRNAEKTLVATGVVFDADMFSSFTGSTSYPRSSDAQKIESNTHEGGEISATGVPQIEYNVPFKRCLLPETSSYVESEFQEYFDDAVDDKFEMMDSVGATSMPSHLGNEDDKSSVASLLHWHAGPSDVGAKFGEVTSFESPLLRPLRKHEAGDVLSGRLPPPETVPGWLLPPSSLNSSETKNGGDWSTAGSSSRQRQRRKIEDHSGHVTGIAISPHQRVVTFGPHDIIASANGMVPSYDNFAINRSGRGNMDDEMMADGAGEDSSRLPPIGLGVVGNERIGVKSLSVNDFQKRAREYSVGSVGSW